MATMTESLPTLDAESVAARLTEAWALGVVALERLGGGMNSQTWLVTSDGGRWVAKIVPEAMATKLAGGLAVAARIEAGGIPAGAPVAARNGELVVNVGASGMALLTYVDGDGLTWETEAELRLIGGTLARAHRALNGLEIPGADRFHWLELGAEHLAIRPWIRPAIENALAVWEGLPPESLTWGLLHTDPAPEAFLLDAAGTCGLIDWDRALVGPLMYDVASAVMYVGGPRFGGALIDAYVAGGGLERSEIDRSLLPMLRFRWAVQAFYFAERVATNDMTGISDPAENEDGLEDARQALAEIATAT